MFDAMVTAAWLAARTERLVIGHLVLCDAFRHPAVLAKQVVSLDHASGGRFELGIGWGSVPAEFDRFGIGSTEPAERVGRLARDPGRGHVAVDRRRGRLLRRPPPPRRRPSACPPRRDDIPIVIGGAGPKTLALVAEHATWWNCPIYALDRFDALRPRTGDSRASIQEMVGFIPDEESRGPVTDAATRRFGIMGEDSSSATPTSCSTTTGTCTPGESNASTCGSPTSRTRARSRRSAPRSSPRSEPARPGATTGRFSSGARAWVRAAARAPARR